MKRINEIYQEYKIYPALQNHMLRVAAVATLICDNFEDPLPKDDMVLTCLLHDMGNILKAKMDTFPQFFEPEGLAYWQKVQEEYRQKYGENEHVATEKIIRELGLPEDIVSRINSIGFSNASKNEQEENFENKICNYSDMRVGPHGVLPLQERLLEGHKRYQGRNHTIASDNFESLAQSVRNIEKQIFAKCKIKPGDINDETVAPIISKLRDYVIK